MYFTWKYEEKTRILIFLRIKKVKINKVKINDTEPMKSNSSRDSAFKSKSEKLEVMKIIFYKLNKYEYIETLHVHREFL